MTVQIMSEAPRIIIGARNEEQLCDNVDATTLTLTVDDLATLERVSALPNEYPGWMIARQTVGREPAPR